ncbi:hypothetical protein, partial [Methylobacterium soli]|uniref:hypothetical protein n=1 Tax=Methylobacterium soli TaxID=553447 RepID=UPI001EE32868
QSRPRDFGFRLFPAVGSPSALGVSVQDPLTRFGEGVKHEAFRVTRAEAGMKKPARHGRKQDHSKTSIDPTELSLLATAKCRRPSRLERDDSGFRLHERALQHADIVAH